jgi:DNA-binding beta-propeller fold protein YncE
LVAHHIFYDRTMTKAYVSALGKSEMRIMDLTANPYRIKTMAVPGCVMGEDVIFNEANTKWYLTCMGSANVIVGDVKTDKTLQEIKLPGTYPHGLAVNTAIDRILVSSTVSGDLKKPDEVVSVVEASTGKLLGAKKLSKNPGQPMLMKSLPAGAGAHHVGITKDEKLAFVQSALLNLPGLDSGTITVVDLENEKVIDTITTLADMGLNPNPLVLLPKWNHFGGH